MVKIVKIGTFNNQGFPLGWSIDTKDSEELKHILGILGDKVYVNGVEIVQWTEGRKRCMEGG